MSRTRLAVERYADAHGMTKGDLVEQALRHHLQALEALPADLVVPPSLRATRAAFERVVERLASPRKPRRAMRTLMAGPERRTR